MSSSTLVLYIFLMKRIASKFYRFGFVSYAKIIETGFIEFVLFSD